MKEAKIFSLLFLLFLNSFAQNSKKGSFKMVLKDQWKMQSFLTDHSSGKEVSMPGFITDKWYPVTVPTTILAGLLANKEYDFDPFFGRNFEKISDPRFDSSWWFRKEFRLPASEKGKTVTLGLQGINYRANIWLNGILVAEEKTVTGPFRVFTFDITKLVHGERINVLAISVTRPFNPNRRDGDLAIDYADWIHYPPDYNGGIINNVEIQTCEKVVIRYPMVTTKFDLPSLELAHLQVDAQLVNYSEEELDVSIHGKINDQVQFEQKMHLGPKEIKEITFTPEEYSQLNVKNPRIWWPWQYGKQEMNSIEIEVKRNNRITSVVTQNFGIRQVTSRLIDSASREFSINGRPIMLRGAAWSPDIFQRRSEKRQEQEIKLVRDMNMNIIRSEGKLEDDHFYDLCDKYGMLVMTGWMCCGAWQFPENWSPFERTVAMGSDSSVMYWLRNKASVFVWLNGSDMPPKDSSVEHDFIKIENDLKWQNPILSTADETVSKVSGHSGVKMNGPYDWVPPAYWEADTAQLGGAWSFATEISPGPSIPPYESLVKFIPKDSLWYNTSDWLYHCGTMKFGTTNIFNDALNARYGKTSTIKEYVAKAQVQNYEAHRAMMEAYGLNKYHTATGVVQWMLSNPWPSLIWHTYDYYLYPAGTYFGIKKSLEPLHIQYSYKSKEIIIVNSFLKSFSNLKAEAKLFTVEGELKFSKTVVAAVDKDGIKRCFTIPEPDDLPGTYFLRLQLNDASGKPASINWYWLSKRSDSLNWKKSEWFYTPQSQYADFNDLAKLNETTLKMQLNTAAPSTGNLHQITINNTGKTVAFFVHLRALKGKNGEDILPVIFSDNYLLLAPGETRTIDCRYDKNDSGNSSPYIQVSGWNIDTEHSLINGNAGFVREMQ